LRNVSRFAPGVVVVALRFLASGKHGVADIGDSHAREPRARQQSDLSL